MIHCRGSFRQTAREEEFPVPLGAENGRGDHSDHLKAQSNDAFRHFAADSFVNERVSHDPALAHEFPSCFELGLDEGDEPRSGREERNHSRQHQPERDEGGVHRRDVDAYGKEFGGEGANVLALDDRSFHASCP